MKLFIVIAIALLTSLLNVTAAVQIKIEPSVTISWQSEAGKFYRILTCTNLASPVWEAEETNVIGNGEVIARAFSQAQRVFFQVTEEIPNFTGSLLNRENLTNISNVKFDGAEMTTVNFDGPGISSNFDSTVMVGCFLDDVNFDFANFQNAQLLLITAQNATFQKAYFGGAQVFSADFQNTNFKGALFTNATLTFCDFRGATNLNLAGATCHMCFLPDGTVRDD